MYAWRKLRRLDARDVVLSCDALVMLTLARVCITLLPFRSLARVANPVLGSHSRSDADLRALCRRVRKALERCARRVPFRALCFEQGLAAQWMLHRRGIPSVMYFGAAPDRTTGVIAHVWVRVGDIDVVGGANAKDFATLATFPAQQ